MQALFSSTNLIALKNEQTKVQSKFLRSLSNKEKLLIQLTKIQKDILVGTVLGDAYIERSKASHNARLRYDQTFPHHASYLMTIYSHLYNLTGKGPRIIIRKPDIRTGKIYYQMQFETLNLPCLNTYHELFYKDGKKVIPQSIGELLTARSLAYWIMDDGGKSSSKTQTILYTRSHTLEEVLLLQEVLKFNFKLKTTDLRYGTIYEKVKGQWIIIIPLKQEVSLKDIVLPYMHTSMLY